MESVPEGMMVPPETALQTLRTKYRAKDYDGKGEATETSIGLRDRKDIETIDGELMGLLGQCCEPQGLLLPPPPPSPSQVEVEAEAEVRLRAHGHAAVVLGSFGGLLGLPVGATRGEK